MESSIVATGESSLPGIKLVLSIPGNIQRVIIYDDVNLFYGLRYQNVPLRNLMNLEEFWRELLIFLAIEL